MNWDDRRVDTRIENVNFVQVSRFNEEGFRADMATGLTVNLSRGGMRLVLHHPLPLRSKVTLDLALGNELVQVPGTVVYLEALDDESCCMGIEFDEVDSTTEAQLHEILALRQNSEAETE